MRVYLKTSNDTNINQDVEKICSLPNRRGVYANISEAHFHLKLGGGKKIYLFGDIFYHIKTNGNIKLINSDNNSYLAKIFTDYSLSDVITRLEEQYIGIWLDSHTHKIKIFSDRYARIDSFYTYDGSDFYLATDLDFIFEHITPQYDQKMLMHLFFVYGWYVPKGLTIYGNVKRLRVGEIITISDAGMQSDIIEFKPLGIEDYEDLEHYYKILKEAVTARVNQKGKIWVSSSNGWDSSLVLGILVDEFDPKNVRMLTGSMKYSERTEAINKFEIDKIKKIGEYYGIKPAMVDLDFKNKRTPEYWKKSLPYYKSKHIYTYVTFNFSKLSDGLRNIAETDQIIFNGEAADPFHNFGFSQFATFLHSKKSFTEYADKMNCYLYGSSFFKKIIEGKSEGDKVFQIFRKMMDGVEFTSGWSSRENAVENYLFPFFHGSPRLPFTKTYENPLLNEKGKQAIYRFPFREYMPEVLSGLTEKNIYSWLIYLYLSFLAQSSTTNIHKHGMETGNHKWRMPFNDYRMITFLSKAPESWARGLEFVNTKYSLKWDLIKWPISYCGI